MKEVCIIGRSAGWLALHASRQVHFNPKTCRMQARKPGVSQFRRAGPWAFPPGRQRPGSDKDEALKRPSPPWQSVFPKGHRRERALPAPCTTSARPFTAWHWGVSQFRRAGPWALPPGRQRPGSDKDEALKRPSPPWQSVFPKGHRRERALPAPCTTSARPFTAWPAGPRRFWDTPGLGCHLTKNQKSGKISPSPWNQKVRRRI